MNASSDTLIREKRYNRSMAILQISKKEYASRKALQKNGFHQEILFVLSDGRCFMNTTKGAVGLNEIMKFRLKAAEQKHIDAANKEKQQNLLEIEKVLS